jgi:hypothetical protein
MAIRLPGGTSLLGGLDPATAAGRFQSAGDDSMSSAGNAWVALNVI